MTFQGDELEGKRSRVLFCRGQLKRMASGQARPELRQAICFQRYRAEVERQRSVRAAGELDTASVQRFQSALSFEPVDRALLNTLKARRTASRTPMTEGVERFVDKQRQAQIAARHALQRSATRLSTRAVSASPSQEGDRVWASAVHAAEFQLPESWLPWVVSRWQRRPETGSRPESDLTHAILSPTSNAGPRRPQRASRAPHRS